jgi:predicted dehydrogenase
MITAADGRVRMAVIGIGHLGRHHVRLLSNEPGVSLVAAVDLARDRAAAAVAGTGAEALDDPRALFDRVDAVVVAVPTAAHRAIAGEFLRRGVHVLVEKPMAATLADADAMIGLAERAGATLAVGHVERFNPAVAAAMTVLQQPRFVEVHRLSGFPERSLDVDVIFDVMIHDLDIVLAMDRSDVLAVEAVGVPVLSPRVDIANARLRFASGCVANITASRISRDRIREVRCFQPDMYVSIDYAEQELEVWRLAADASGKPAIAGGRVEVAKDEPLRRELADFVEAVRDRRPPLVTAADGRRALALAARVAEAIEKGAA